MDKIEALQNLGISEKAARAYLALLELGRGSAYSVAKKSGLKQPTAYVVLEELRASGLALKIPRPKKHLFVPKPPSEVFSLATSKLELLRGLLPELSALANKSETKVKTLFYEGAEGLRQALWYRIDELNDKDFVAFWASGVDIHDKKLSALFHEWNQEMFFRNITSRAIAPDHPSLKEFRALDKAYKQEVKIIHPEKYSASISIDANDYFVRILMFKELQCVIIDNPSVAKTVRQIFDLMWSGLP